MTETTEMNRRGVAAFRISGERARGVGDRAPLMPDTSAEVQAGDARRDTTPRFSRSRQMADCLRCDLLYSEKRPRDLLFRAIEQVVAEHSRDPVILSRLTREAAARARRAAEVTGFAFRHWETASKAVVKTMLSAGVLVTTDGSAILPGITAQATPVAGLAPSFVDITEAFLLEVLIRRLGDVTTRDHTALAHALFRQFDPGVPLEELEDRVVILVAQLAERVELRGELYCARDVTPAPGSA